MKQLLCEPLTRFLLLGRRFAAYNLVSERSSGEPGAALRRPM